MANSTKQTPLTQDHDSFLDIVANIVGILIILVMVVSVRARQAPPETEASDPAELPTAPDQISHAALQQDVARLLTESARLEDYISIRSVERNRLSLLLATAERTVTEDRASLKHRDRELYDLQASVRTARGNLQELEMERIRAATIEPNREQIESLPTPIGKSVFGREVHFQLLAGRVAHVPIEALFEEARQQARQKVWKLDKLPEATETVGPKDGFHMRYTLEKLHLPPQVRMETGRTGFMIRSKLWELIPVSGRLGEPVEMALGENSAFRGVLARLDPRQTTVTLWTYPDSFAAFRTVKRELFELGFDAAARPLPAGVRIAGSPSGSRSTAQ